MPNQSYSRSDRDRKNDVRLLTPLLLMALIMVGGVLLYAYADHSFAAIL